MQQKIANTPVQKVEKENINDYIYGVWFDHIY